MMPVRRLVKVAAALVLAVPSVFSAGGALAASSPAVSSSSALLVVSGPAGRPAPGAMLFIGKVAGFPLPMVTVSNSAGLDRHVLDPGFPVADVEYDADASQLALLGAGGLYLATPAMNSVHLVLDAVHLGQPTDLEWAAGSNDTLFLVGSGDRLVRKVRLGQGQPTVTVIGTVPGKAPIQSVLPSPGGDALLLAEQSTVASYDVMSVSTGASRPVPVPPGLIYRGRPVWSLDGASVLFPGVARTSLGTLGFYSWDLATFSQLNKISDLGAGAAGLTLLGAVDGLGRQLAQIGVVNGPLPRQGTILAVDEVTGVLTSIGPGPTGQQRTPAATDDISVAPGGPDVTGSCAGYTPTILGTPGDDVIVGTPGRDVIKSLGGNDVIYGLGGNDVLCGGDGNDTIFGGPGADLIYGEQGDDQLHGGDGADVIGGSTGNDTITGGGGPDQISGGPGDDKIAGGDGNDVVRGGPGMDTIDTGAGDDMVLPGTGPDIVSTGVGNDVVVTDTLSGGQIDLGDGNDTAFSDDFRSHNVFGPPLTVNGGGGNDRIAVTGATVQAGPGDDVVTAARWANGGDGNDLLYGLGVRDASTLLGGLGNDQLFEGTLIEGGPGDDTIRTAGTGTAVADGGDGNDILKGSRAHDTLKGGPGDDLLQGSRGDDTLEGGKGNDKLSGGPGNDTLNGGGGHDLCQAGDSIPYVSCEVVYPRP